VHRRWNAERRAPDCLRAESLRVMDRTAKQRRKQVGRVHLATCTRRTHSRRRGRAARSVAEDKHSAAGMRKDRNGTHLCLCTHVQPARMWRGTVARHSPITQRLGRGDAAQPRISETARTRYSMQIRSRHIARAQQEPCSALVRPKTRAVWQAVATRQAAATSKHSHTARERHVQSRAVPLLASVTSETAGVETRPSTLVRFGSHGAYTAGLSAPDRTERRGSVGSRQQTQKP
jgi:hypothetical protein